MSSKTQKRAGARRAGPSDENMGMVRESERPKEDVEKMRRRRGTRVL